MDIRTYDADSDVDAEQMTHFDAYAELAAHMSLLQQAEAENARLTEELDTRIRELMQASRKLAATRRANTANAKAAAEHRQTAQTLADENNRLRADVDTLGKALNMALAERDEAYREVDAQTLKANSFRSELHRYIAHANELKEMLDTSVAERDALRAELVDAETRARLASDLLQRITEDLAHERQQRRELERQLDAMREAHSVIQARCAAMGC